MNHDFVRLFRIEKTLLGSEPFPSIQSLEQSLTDSQELNKTMRLFQGFNPVRWPPLIIKDENNTFDIWDHMTLVYVRDRSASLYNFIFFLVQQYKYLVVLPGSILTMDSDCNKVKLPGGWKNFSIDSVCDAQSTKYFLDKWWFDLEESKKTIFKCNLGVPGVLPSRRECLYIEACVGETAVAHQDFMMKQNYDNLPLARTEISADRLGPGMCGAVFWELTLPSSSKFFAYECGGFGQRRWFESLARMAGRQTAMIEEYDHINCSSGEKYSLDECQFDKIVV